MGTFKYENLNVWKKALDLAVQIRESCKLFPKAEKFVLAVQLIRAADSVCLNIAEGSTGQTKREQINFLRYAMRSAIEVTAGLHIALKLNYLPNTKFNELYYDNEILVKMLKAFINNVNAQL